MGISMNELFSGIGAQRKALLNIGFDVEVIGISEIDKYAIQSYEAIFGKTRNYGDISTVEKLDYADLWTYSFPCTDISVAGLQKGINENTRSGLLYQVQRLLDRAKIDGTLPKYLLLENVKNLVGKQFKPQFDEWIKYLDELGYKTYWQVLNAKDYGIPQNRERVFAVSIRKDVNLDFAFPPKIKLEKRLKDLLEDKVDEKFYLNQEKVNILFKQIEDKILVKEATKKGYATATVGDSINIEQPNSKTRRGRVGHEVAQTLTTQNQQCVIDTCFISNQSKTLEKFTDVACTLMARDYKGFGNQRSNAVIQIGNIVDTTNCSWDNPQRGRIYSSDGISPTLNTMQGGGLEPKIVIEQDLKMFNPYNKSEIKNVAPTQTTGCGSTTTSSSVCIVQLARGNNKGGCKQIAPTITSSSYEHNNFLAESLRVRKLTPKECWRLMGFDDEDFEKAKASGVSNSQLYKQAGNSIVVNVLEDIFVNFMEWE